MGEPQVGAELDISTVLEGIAGLRPDEDCVVFRDRRISWSAFTERTRRLANALIESGLGIHAERSARAGHESGQDHVAIYLQNGVEYLECMVGAWKARVAPFNVNYRYVADELSYLLADAGARAIVVHSRFAPTLAEVLPDVPRLGTIIQVPDDSGHELLPGARWYEDALAAASSERPPVAWSPDDLYILYTGGTTGMPKGVMWRNGDAMIECFSGSPTARTLDDFLGEADVRFRALITPPFMHGAGHWVAFRVLLGGGTVCLPSEVQHLDPDDVWRTVERERADFMLIVGDAFARPLLDQLERADYDLSSLNVVLSGGAALSKARKEDLLRHLPTVMIVDGMGSSEAGGQLAHVSTASGASTGSFPPRPGTHVLSAALDRELTPGEDEVGWLAKSGRLALGYLGDGEKTARTYPIVDGVRYAVPGDRARLLADGSHRDARARRRHDQLGRGEDLRRGGRGGGQGAPRRLRLRRDGAAQRALGQRGGRRRRAAARRRRHARRAAGGSRAPPGPLQAAQGHRVRRRRRPFAGRQGRLPVGPRGRGDRPQRGGALVA